MKKTILSDKKNIGAGYKTIFISSLIASVVFFIVAGWLYYRERFMCPNYGCGLSGTICDLVAIFVGLAIIAICEIIKVVASIHTFRATKRKYIQLLVLALCIVFIYCSFRFFFNYPFTNRIAKFIAMAYFIFAPINSWSQYSSFISGKNKAKNGGK